jgi:hypothetical protein
MYATIRKFSGGALADALSSRESDIRQEIGEIDGFRAYYLTRTSDGDTLTISIFDDAAGGEESTRGAKAWIQENLADLSIGAPEVTGGEVIYGF